MDILINEQSKEVHKQNGVLGKLDHIEKLLLELKGDMALAIRDFTTKNEILNTKLIASLDNLSSKIDPIRDSISLKALRWMMFLIVAVVSSIKVLEYFLMV